MSSHRGSASIRQRTGSGARAADTADHADERQQQFEDAGAETVRHLKNAVTLTTEAEDLGTETLRCVCSASVGAR